MGLKRRGSMVIQHCRSKSQRLEETQGWSSLRLTCWKFLRNQWFEAAISIIVCFNLVLIIYEADYDAQCFPDYFGNYKSCPFKSAEVHWVATCNLVLLFIYTLEAALRVYVFRRRFPFSWWNQLDALVCTTGWIGIAFHGSINLALLRIVRVGRLARAFRFLFRIRELYLLLNGVVSSLKAIFFGTMLLMVMLVAYSIILVEWVHPKNSQITYSTCSECTTAFRSVWWSTITLFKQVIAGDSWIISYPLIESQPGVAFVMMVIVVTVSLGMINLILTVIVERAAEARERDVAENVKQKQKAQETVKHELLKICEEMDDDEDGQLSAEELRWAYQDSEAFRNVMMTLDIRESDLESVFKVLDSDGTGELEYHEFCEELVQLQGQDVRVMVALTRQRVSEILAGVERLDRKIMDSNQAQDAKLDFLMAQWKENQAAPAKQAVTNLKPADPLPSSSNTRTNGHASIDACTDIPPRMPNLPSAEAEVVHRAENQVSTLARLQAEIQDLACTEADVMHEVEKQISTLLSHVELAASVVDVLPHRDSLHEACAVPKQSVVSPEHLHIISRAAEEIQHSTHTPLVEMMQTLNTQIRAAGRVLDKQEGLFRKIKELAPQYLFETNDTSPYAVHPMTRM